MDEAKVWPVHKYKRTKQRALVITGAYKQGRKILRKLENKYYWALRFICGKENILRFDYATQILYFQHLS